MRSTASVLHLDLDAFFAAVEQRDKPSLRGKPVCVGGIGPRGVVATASYEARTFGARSAMPTAQARRLCPAGTAFLAPRFAAYRRSSEVVMQLLRELSPLVEQVSVDEAYVDLAPIDRSDDPDAMQTVVQDLLNEIRTATGGLTASAGIASSKMLAKISSELKKPAGVVLVRPGTELDLLRPMSVRALGGVGPATEARLRLFGTETVADLQRMTVPDLVSIFGEAHGRLLARLAVAHDDREIVTERDAKSISAEETFATDIVDVTVLRNHLRLLGIRVAERLGTQAMFARTVTIKVRQHDFVTHTRSATFLHPTGEREVIIAAAVRLLDGVDLDGGLRLIGLGVAGLTTHAQDQFVLDLDAGDTPETGISQLAEPATQTDPGGVVTWSPGADVRHTEFGTGWVWGGGLGRVTVRFEGPLTSPGPVRTFFADDPALTPADPPDWLES